MILFRNTSTVVLLIALAVLLFPVPSRAQLFIVDMNNVDYLDTIYTCDNYEGIKFWPDSRITENSMWHIAIYENNQWIDDDTVYADTLILSGNFREGYVNHSGTNGQDFYGSLVEVRRLVVNTSYIAGTCNSPLQLNASTNYSGEGIPLYNWEPAENLSDTTIANPTTFLKSDIEYTVTVTVPNGCVASKTVNVIMDPLTIPSICMVSIDNTTNKNVIYWEKPAISGIDSILIFRETDVTNVFQKIGGLAYNDPGSFIDINSFPLIQSNKYVIEVKDSCGFRSEQSEPHRTIHLSISQGLNNSWNLIWEPYLGFEVSTYRIFRGTDASNLELIGTTAGGSTQYTDFSAPSEFISYQIEVVNPDNCDISGLKSTLESLNKSLSNIASNKPVLIKINPSLQQYSIFPNPFSDILHIDAIQGNENAIIELTDLTGRIMKVIDLQSGKYNLDESDLKKGLYIIIIRTNQETSSHIVIKK